MNLNLDLLRERVSANAGEKGLCLLNCYLDSLNLNNHSDYCEIRGLLYGLCIAGFLTQPELFDYLLRELSDIHYGEVCNDLERFNC